MVQGGVPRQGYAPKAGHDNKGSKGCLSSQKYNSDSILTETNQELPLLLMTKLNHGDCAFSLLGSLHNLCTIVGCIHLWHIRVGTTLPKDLASVQHGSCLHAGHVQKMWERKNEPQADENTNLDWKSLIQDCPGILNSASLLSKSLSFPSCNWKRVCSNSYDS